MITKILTVDDVNFRLTRIVQQVREYKNQKNLKSGDRISIFGVPRGGTHVAYLLKLRVPFEVKLVYDVSQADVIVDDIVDSGKTRDRYLEKNEKAPFFSLYTADELAEINQTCWLVFPWEQAGSDSSADDIPIRLLQYLGEDINRGGLKETPKRFLKAWKFWTSGYSIDPAAIFKTFEDGAERYDQMVLVKDIPVWSMCEHHLAPFFGVCHVAYIPNERIVGLSKFSRLVDVYARRLQVQERLTNQICEAIFTFLKPKGVGVLLDCRHSCMESRGIEKAGISTITSDLRGLFLTDRGVRDEFLGLVGRN